MVAINHYGVDEEEVDSLVQETNQENSNTSPNTNIRREQRLSASSQSSTISKVLALILVGLILFFAIDSIQIKRTNKGALTQGDLQERTPNDLEPEFNAPTPSYDGTVDVDIKAKPTVETKAPAANSENTPVVYENETPRYAYKNRGQPMPDDMAKEQTDKWGEWKPMTKERPQHDFYKDYPNRDVPRTKFPSNAWQLDKVYMKEFLTQGKDLVMRAMEAILAEYGHGVDDEPGVSFETRSSMFQLRFLDLESTIYGKDGNAGGKDGGSGDDGGWTTNRSWAGLKLRLWHAIMTEDSFNFAVGGHSAAAGHGNHFSQSYTLQVAWIMEPIFARLGVKHQSRNFGNGGLGTQQNAIAGGSIYGPDVDLLMWDSGT
jgi:hypothetical protein